MVLLGMIYGVVIVGSVSQQTLSKLAFITDEFLDQRLVQSVLITFWHSFVGSASLLLVAFVCGFCAIAQPIPIGILLFRGFGLGLSLSYLYVNNGMSGVFCFLLLVLPQAVIATFALALGARESIRFSNHLFSFVVLQKEVQATGMFKLYLIKFLVLCGFTLVAALLDGICTFLFAGLFV